MANRFDIDLSNFQSIGAAKLSFETGITLLVGQSNSGKSAILRAIKAVLNNPSRAKTYIKHGKTSSCVEITVDNNTISWGRSGKESSYTINDESYAKVGNKTLFDLLPDNGFVRDDEDNIMNIEGELELPFPFDRTPSQLFKLFENIFCVSDSATILKSFKDDELRYNKEISTTEEKLKRLAAKATALDELEKEVDLNGVKRDLKSFKELYDNYEELSSDISHVQRCAAISGLVFDEVTEPETYTLEEYVETRKDLSFLFHVVTRQKFLKELEPVLKVPDTLDGYEELSGDLSIIENAHRLDNLEMDMESPMETTTLDDYLELYEDIKEIERSEKASKFNMDDVPEISEQPLLETYLEMLSDYKDIVNCYQSCKAKKSAYEEAEQKIGTLQEKLKDYKVCPLCGHELTGEENIC